jgi:cobalt-zinc-cadmium resistance protein CzcA
VKGFDEVESVVTKIGRPDLATEAMGIHQGDVYVMLKPKELWNSGRDKDGLIEALDEELSKLPGVTYNFTQPMAMRLDETISGVKADVAVKLFGEDLGFSRRFPARPMSRPRPSPAPPSCRSGSIARLSPAMASTSPISSI